MTPEEFNKLSMQEQAEVWPSLSSYMQSLIRSGQRSHRYAEILNEKSERQRLAYIILALFLGCLGVHNFYAARTTQGILQVLVFIASGLLLYFGIGFVTLAALWIWAIIEICVVTKDGEGLIMK